MEGRHHALFLVPTTAWNWILNWWSDSHIYVLSFRSNCNSEITADVPIFCLNGYYYMRKHHLIHWQVFKVSSLTIRSLAEWFLAVTSAGKVITCLLFSLNIKITFLNTLTCSFPTVATGFWARQFLSCGELYYNLMSGLSIPAPTPPSPLLCPHIHMNRNTPTLLQIPRRRVMSSTTSVLSGQDWVTHQRRSYIFFRSHG